MKIHREVLNPFGMHSCKNNLFCLKLVTIWCLVASSDHKLYKTINLTYICSVTCKNGCNWGKGELYMDIIF